jgi:putative redox protein
MKTKTIWKEKMLFDGVNVVEAPNESHEVKMDAKSPIGSGKGFTPKELVALGVSGCTAMDVAALMKKYKQNVTTFEVEANVTLSEKKMPTVFTNVKLTFHMTGPVDKDKYIEAVTLSQTKYCGVTAMLLKAVPVHYTIVLNGEQIGMGEAQFE